MSSLRHLVLPGKSSEKHNIMSSSKRKRLKEEKEAGLSTPWKKYGLDIDTLECPICTETFSPPVFQCDNGHTACSNCCQKLNTRGCPSCSLPIGRIRCLAIEKVIESLWVECELGCTTRLRFRDRDEHERSLCESRPMACPKHGCTHKGPMYTITDHLADKHNMETVTLWCESTRSASFNMRDSEGMSVLVKAKEAWLLVSLLRHRSGHRSTRDGSGHRFNPDSSGYTGFTPYWSGHGFSQNWSGDRFTSEWSGHKFTCESVWAPKEVVVKLTVKTIPQMHMKVYSMECAPRTGDLDQYLYVPGQDNSFDVTVSLIG